MPTFQCINFLRKQNLTCFIKQKSLILIQQLYKPKFHIKHRTSNDHIIGLKLSYEYGTIYYIVFFNLKV